MSNTKKYNEFFKKVEEAGLLRAFSKISDLASETLDCYLEDIVDDFVAEQERPLARIRYEQSGDNEYYIMESRPADEDEWTFCSSWLLTDDKVHYTALTQIREFMRYGYNVFFGDRD